MTPDGFAPFVPRVVSVRPQMQTPPADPASGVVTEEPASPASAISVEEVLPAPDAIDRSAPAESVRESAIKIAGEACARALREAIARNPLFVARFVDDALEAAGPGSGKTARLSPIDAAACRGRVATSVVADEGVAPGEVVVETAHGTVTATIDERAQLLVRAVADS